MSTEIGKVKGRFEANHHGDYSVDYGKSELHVKRFYGGIKNGAMVQLTMSNDKPYIQLTQKQAKKLVKLLNETFDFEKH